MFKALFLSKCVCLSVCLTSFQIYCTRTSLRALVVLLPIFGITWLFGIFGFTSDAIAAMYIFVILNASQGLLIFVFHCALNAEVMTIYHCENINRDYNYDNNSNNNNNNDDNNNNYDNNYHKDDRSEVIASFVDTVDRIFMMV